MKYLYPYECEKLQLSSPGELQAAIGRMNEAREREEMIFIAILFFEQKEIDVKDVDHHMHLNILRLHRSCLPHRLHLHHHQEPVPFLRVQWPIDHVRRNFWFGFLINDVFSL